MPSRNSLPSMKDVGEEAKSSAPEDQPMEPLTDFYGQPAEREMLVVQLTEMVGGSALCQAVGERVRRHGLPGAALTVEEHDHALDILGSRRALADFIMLVLRCIGALITGVGSPFFDS